MNKRLLGFLLIVGACVSAVDVAAGNGSSRPAECGSSAPAGYSVPRYKKNVKKKTERPFSYVAPYDVEAKGAGISSVEAADGTIITSFYLPVGGAKASRVDAWKEEAAVSSEDALRLQQQAAQQLAALEYAKSAAVKGLGKGHRRVTIPAPRYFTFEGYGEDDCVDSARTDASNASSVAALSSEEYLALWLQTRAALISFGKDIFALRETLHYSLHSLIGKAEHAGGCYADELEQIADGIKVYQLIEAKYKALLQKEAQELWFGGIDERHFVTSVARPVESAERFFSLVGLVEGSFDFLSLPKCYLCSSAVDIEKTTTCCCGSMIVPEDDFFEGSLMSLCALSDALKVQQTLLRACLQKAGVYG